MSTVISFRANETTGGVADRTIETAKQETTGSVGARKNQASIFNVDNDLKQDTVCFRGAEQKNSKKPSTFSVILGSTIGLAALVVGLGYAHKYDVVGKIKNEKVKDFLKHTDVVTKPCHDACTWVKKNCYTRIKDYFNKK